MPGGTFAEHSGVPCQWYSTARPYFEDLVAALRAAGFGAFLIGERFMTVPNPGEGLARLIAEARAVAEARG